MKKNSFFSKKYRFFFDFPRSGFQTQLFYTKMIASSWATTYFQSSFLRFRPYQYRLKASSQDFFQPNKVKSVLRGATGAKVGKASDTDYIGADSDSDSD